VIDVLAARPGEWQAAVTHSFLDDVRAGTLDERAFDRWLVQDRLFVDVLLRAQAGILAAAPPADRAVLVGGLAALVDELSWFEDVAQRRALDLDVQSLPANHEYGAFLLGLPSRPYVVAASALWAVERAYLDAWRSAAPGAAAYREFVEHWTVPGFADYVDGLQANADRAWAAAADGDELAAAEMAVLAVARHEAAFWQMAYAD